jgi:hypothetical protein
MLIWRGASDNPGGSGIQGYRVNLQRYDRDSRRGENIELEPLGSIIYQTSTYLPEGLEHQEAYRWRAWAIDNAGNRSEASSWLYFEFYEPED